MTIEEYLNKRIEDLEEGPCNSSLVQGKILAYREILENLPEFEHEVTAREVKEFCQKQLDDCEDDEDPCEYCPMAMECSDSDDCRWMECGEIADILPRDWDIDAIEKRVKEARND